MGSSVISVSRDTGVHYRYWRHSPEYDSRVMVGMSPVSADNLGDTNFMSEQTGRRSRRGYTPVDPAKFIPIHRPSNAALRGAVVTGFVLWIGVGAISAGLLASWFSTELPIFLTAAVFGATLVTVLGVRHTTWLGRRRREDFVRCGGDPAGMTDLMFGFMRGFRTPKGEWEVPEQASGDYQGT